MADKNLHDIKIDESEHQKKTPLKNVLTLLALLFIILVISVVITKLILNTDDEDGINNNPTTTQTNIDTDTNSSNALTATSAVIAGTTAAAIVATTSNGAKGIKNTLSHSLSSPTIKERNVSNSSKTKVTLRDHQPKKTVKEVVAKHKKVTTTPKKKYIEKKYIEKKEVVKKEETKKSIASYHLTKGYYIKVGTFRDISTAVEKVKKTGLNYKLIKTKNDKTMTRVLIGPFSEEEAAKSHLKEVQTDITSGAYITRVKK